MKSEAKVGNINSTLFQKGRSRGWCQMFCLSNTLKNGKPTINCFITSRPPHVVPIMLRSSPSSAIPPVNVPLKKLSTYFFPFLHLNNKTSSIFSGVHRWLCSLAVDEDCPLDFFLTHTTETPSRGESNVSSGDSCRSNC